MRFKALATLLVLGLGFLPGSALAEVQAVGKVKNGYYWQKVRSANGTSYLCHSTSDSKIQKHTKCTAAGALKP
jgi:hypothetical protein